MRKRKMYFDERQLIERGKAYRNAFYTLLVAFFICVIVNRIIDPPVFDYYKMFIMSSTLSISVLYSTLTLRDALYKRTKKDDEDTRFVFSMLIVIIILIALVMIVLNNAPLLKDGVLDETYFMAFEMVCLAEICSVDIVKYIKDRRKAKAIKEPDQIAE